MRECGDCTACCEGWLPDESLGMHPGKPCQHCKAGGCTIYDDRPENPCRVFRCAWLQEADAFPESMRPDRCGAIVLAARYWREWSVLQATPAGEKIPRDTLEWLQEYSSRIGRPLVYFERQIVDGVFLEAGHGGFGPPEFIENLNQASMRVGDQEDAVITPDDVIRLG